MIYLDDLLQADDFTQAVNGLAAAFREKHNFPKIHQLGLVVPDVEKAAEKLESIGFGPFFIANGSPVFWHEKGEERNISGKLGLASHEGFELELLEPTTGSDFYRQSLDPQENIVIQHLGFLVDDIDAWADKMLTEGFPIWIRGQLKTGPSKIDFVYVDSLRDSGLIMEFINWRFLGINFSPPPSLLKFIGRLEKWSGKRSIKI